MSTEAPSRKSYKDTLNLPQTPFPMEAKLVQNEPARLKRWQETRLYQQILRSRADAPEMVLHDGPPFANSDIHIGHVANKTLKDVFIRYKTMAGFQCPYVPGWDCHGLPIEHKIQQDLGPKLREMSVVDVRQRCYAHAQKYAGLQSEQFQRLGILGDWENPYLTMAPEYEAATLEVFADFVAAGLVYKQLKPVHWSIENQTALADAELEYADVEDPSVYVEFPVENPGLLKGTFDLRHDATVSYLIWTTTPWTLRPTWRSRWHPEVEYAFVKYHRNGRDRIAVVASALVEKTFANREVQDVEVLRTVRGDELVAAGVKYRHPFMDRTSPLLTATYVTTTDGTGLVHTAGGHGEEDYATSMQHGIEIYCPVQANGRFDQTVPDWLTTLKVWDANPKIVEKLRELDVLLAGETVTHTYPHDWRSKTKTIFRATEQWFIAVDRKFTPRIGVARRRAVGPVAARARAGRHRVGHHLHPAMGQGADQRHVRISPRLVHQPPARLGFANPRCFTTSRGEALLTPDSVRAVARRFAARGSDAWFTDTPAELLGDYDPGPKFPKDKLRKERDIFDVWFESGSSWHAVCRKRPELTFPADLYLEGSDQHRGWFQLSLLPALGSTGRTPFKEVLTHGFIVGPDGRKVSKSDPNYVTATQEINRHGADLLRLFVCQSDYETDMAASPKMIQDFGDKYRKIRNTLRYLLSNLYDFDPSRHAQEIPPASLDGWASAQLDELIVEVKRAYESYALHRAFRLLHDFCAVQLSAVYANAMKDRMYCEAPHSPLRRRAQTVMHRTVLALTKLLAPMIVFTADEAWEHIAHKPAADAGLPSVHLARLPDPVDTEPGDRQREEWKLLMDLRESALAQLDRLKKEAGLNKALDAEVVYLVDDDDLRRRLQAYGPDLEDLVGAGFHSFAEKGPEGPAVVVRVLDRRTDYKACARSWKRRPDVGQDPRHPDLSMRGLGGDPQYGRQ